MNENENETKIVGCKLSNVLSEFRLTLPRGDVLTDPAEILAFVFRRLKASENAKQSKLAPLAKRPQ